MLAKHTNVVCIILFSNREILSMIVMPMYKQCLTNVTLDNIILGVKIQKKN